MEDKVIEVNFNIDKLRAIIKEEIEALVQKHDDEKQILNGSEVCKMLGIHPSTLNQWKKQNTIPYKRLGRRVFFDKDEVLKAMKDPQRRL